MGNLYQVHWCPDLETHDGIMSLIKTSPLIVRTFKQAMGSMAKNRAAAAAVLLITPARLAKVPIILGPSRLLSRCCHLNSPIFPVSFLGAILVVIFGFFFATVSARMVGLIGSSNNPVSGMAIATLIISTLILKATGTTGTTGMIGSICIGSIICIVAAIVGDTSQDLKTGFIVGATPKLQQIGEMVGVIASSAAIGYVLYLLNAAWGFGSNEIPAPQATMMKMLVEGIMNAELPWALILVGVFIAIVVEILGIPVLPFAVGMYLPFSLSAGIMAGGVVRWILEHRKAANESEEKEKKACIERGTLFTSGLIAGEGLMGVILAICAVAKVDSKFVSPFALPQIGSLIIFIALLAYLYFICVKKSKKAN